MLCVGDFAYSSLVRIGILYELTCGLVCPV